MTWARCTKSQMADEAGCSIESIKRWLKRHGIKIRGKKASSRARYSDRKYRNREWLEKHYLELKMSKNDIAELCGTTEKTIRKWIKEYNGYRTGRHITPVTTLKSLTFVYKCCIIW